MHLFQHYHQHRLDKAFPSDFWLYELSVWLHMLGRSLVAVFIPILLLKVGYSIEDVILFFLAYNLFDVPLNFIARELITKIGARWVIVIGKIWSIGFFILLATITPNNWPLLLLLALLGGLYDTFYWVGHRFMFIKSTGDSPDVGKKTGVLGAVQRFAGFIGPAVGAGILIFFNEHVLVYASVALLMLSILPLLKTDDFPDKPTQKPPSFKSFFSYWQERKNYISTGLFSIHRSAEATLWPLFIFVIFGTIESVAVIPIIVSISAIVFSYFAGHVHRAKRDKAIVLGAFLIVLVWISRMLVSTELFLFFSVFLVSIFSIFVGVPLSSNIFSRAKGLDPLGASTYMNATHMFAKLILFAVLALFVNVFKISFITAVISLFAIIAIHYLYMLFKKSKAGIQSAV